MRVDRTIHLMFALLLTLAAVGGSAPLRGAAFSIDQSDLWWNPDESGWGIQYAHTGNAIFATMYVYGPTNQPTWYVATLEPQPSSDTWSGPLVCDKRPLVRHSALRLGVSQGTHRGHDDLECAIGGVGCADVFH